MTTSLFPFTSLFPALQNNGSIAASAKLAFYLTGTTTLATVYDSDGDPISQSPNINGVKGVEADAFARFPNIYCDDSVTYRVRLCTKLGVQIGHDIDPYQSDYGKISGQLAAGTGATKIGYKNGDASSTTQTVASILDYRVRVSSYAVTGTGDDTTKVQAAISYAQSTGRVLYVDTKVKVTSVTITQTLRIDCDYPILGTATATDEAVVIMNGVSPAEVIGLWVDGANNANYDAALVMAANGGVLSGIDLISVRITNAAVAVQVGRISEPNAQASEINISHLLVFGCAEAVKAIGANTVVNVSTSTLRTNQGAWGNTPWAALPKYTLHAIGGAIYVDTCTVLHAESTDIVANGDDWTVTGSGCCIEPIDIGTADPNPWGHITVGSCPTEVASMLGYANNPNGISDLATDQGGFDFLGARGFHSQDGFPFNLLRTGFTGAFTARRSGSGFYAPNPRSSPTIEVQDNATIDTEDGWCGKNFIQGLAGILGPSPAPTPVPATLNFGLRMVLHALNPNGQSLPATTTTILKFQDLYNNSTTYHFSGLYDPTTGKFTVGVGGLKSVFVNVGLVTSDNTKTRNLAVYLNGGIAGYIGGTTGPQNGLVPLVDLVEGDVVWVSYINTDSTGVTTTGGALDHFTIMAYC